MKKLINYIFIILIVFLFPIIGNAKEKEVTLYLFHGDGCPHCAEEIEYLDSIYNDYEELKIVKYEVWYNEQNAELLSNVENAFEIKRTGGVPVTIIGDTVIRGYSETTSNKIKRAIEYYIENDYVDQIERIKNGTFVKEETEDNFSKKEKKEDKEYIIKVPLFGKVNFKNVSLITAAGVIGLIDGFNPCAMWILLFLLSVLIGMKDRKRMWIIGLTFLITSALVYMLIMLSWLQIAVKMTTVIWIRNIIALIALVGAFINIRSFIRSRDSGCEVVDDKKRKKIFKKIKQFTHEKSLAIALLGVIGLAVSVNLVELACSAGLPLVFTELLALNNTSSMMRFTYTLLYIIFFLLDDLIIFFIAMFTMKITGISSKYNKYSHLLGGIIMLIVGILLLFKPEWLMFQFK